MISVCMATYNGEKYIKEQIDSILSQLSLGDELIISDDMSTDSTRNIIKSFEDERVHLYLHRKNHGFVKNFENALRHAKGDVIFLSDQDDIWFPNKVKRTLEELERVDFTVSDCRTVDKNGQVISDSRIRDFNIKTGFWRLMIKTRYLGCCMAFKRSILRAVLPFPNNSLYLEHDLWIAAVAECYFKTSLIDEPLIIYRRHGDNASSGGVGKENSLLIKLRRRVYRIIQLIKIRKKVKAIKNKEIRQQIDSRNLNHIS